MAKMLVLGDSIQWGQGLATGEKLSDRVAAAWRSKDPSVSVTRFAHSGADVWREDESGALAALDPWPHPFPSAFAVSDADIGSPQSPGSAPDAASRDAIGEVPAETPYLLRQIWDAVAFAGTDFDLILVDAGINDTEVYNLVLPGKNQAVVVERGRSFGPRLRAVLERLRDSFPKAKVIVTGYYPVVSEQSDTRQLIRLWRKVAEAAGEEVADEARKLLGIVRMAEATAVRGRVADLHPTHPVAPFARELAARCRAWTSTVHAVIEDEIAAVDPTGKRMRFADPAFRAAHAVFAPQTLLWRFEDGKPTDARARERAEYCAQHGIRGFRRLIIECASMGHPSPEGAQRYAKAVIARAHELQLF